jgi:hypothetical protein
MSCRKRSENTFDRNKCNPFALEKMPHRGIVDGDEDAVLEGEWKNEGCRYASRAAPGESKVRLRETSRTFSGSCCAR